MEPVSSIKRNEKRCVFSNCILQNLRNYHKIKITYLVLLLLQGVVGQDGK